MNGGAGARSAGVHACPVSPGGSGAAGPEGGGGVVFWRGGGGGGGGGGAPPPPPPRPGSFQFSVRPGCGFMRSALRVRAGRRCRMGQDGGSGLPVTPVLLWEMSPKVSLAPGPDPAGSTSAATSATVRFAAFEPADLVPGQPAWLPGSSIGDARGGTVAEEEETADAEEAHERADRGGRDIRCCLVVKWLAGISASGYCFAVRLPLAWPGRGRQLPRRSAVRSGGSGGGSRGGG
jgi:hypothetical protein